MAEAKEDALREVNERIIDAASKVDFWSRTDAPTAGSDLADAMEEKMRIKGEQDHPGDRCFREWLRESDKRPSER